MNFARFQESPPRTAWLVRDDDVLATVRVLLGWKPMLLGGWKTSEPHEPVVISPGFWAQSVRSPIALDVALLDVDGVVIRTMRLGRNRMAVPTLSARSVLRAKQGAFGTWDVKIGDVMSLRDCE